jgi:hypothetical protein
LPAAASRCCCLEPPHRSCGSGDWSNKEKDNE